MVATLLQDKATAIAAGTTRTKGFRFSYAGQNALILAMDAAALSSGLNADKLDVSVESAADDYAALTTAQGGNRDLAFTARARGPAGEAPTVRYLDPGANNAALSVSVSGQDITVNLATGVAGAITSTGALVLAAVNADATASTLVSAALAPGSTGAGAVQALSKTALSLVWYATGDAFAQIAGDAAAAVYFKRITSWLEHVRLKFVLGGAGTVKVGVKAVARTG